MYRSNSLSFLFLFVCFLQLFQCCCSQSNSSTTYTFDPEGFGPLYYLATRFIVAIFRSTPVSSEEIDNLQDPNYWRDHWQQVLKAHAGLLACIVFGVAFIVLMPFIGCFVCCCRVCCHRCGGAKEKQEKRMDKCRRVTLGLIALTVLCIMLFSVVCIFVTAARVRDAAPRAPSAVAGALNQAHDFLQNDLFTEARNELDDVESKFIALIKQPAQDAAQLIWDGLDSATNTTIMLNKTNDLSAAAALLQQQFDLLMSGAVSLQNNFTSIEQKTARIRGQLTTSMLNCSTPTCNDTINSILSQLISSADFNAIINAAINSTNTALKQIDTQNMTNEAFKNAHNFDQYLPQINQTIDKQVADILMKVPEFKNETEKILDRIQRGVNNSLDEIDFKGMAEKINATSASYINDYINYSWWYPCLAIGILTLLLVVFYLLGLAFGSCAEPPDDYNRCNNRGHGANLIVCAICTYFLVCWLLMLICMLLFIGFGVSHRYFCYPLIEPTENKEFFKVLNYTMATNFNGTIMADIDIYKVLTECDANKGILNVVTLPADFSLDALLDWRKNFPDIVQSISSLNNLPFDSVQFNSTNLQNIIKYLVELKNAGLTNIQFNEMAQKVNSFQSKLPDLVDVLKNAAANMPAASSEVATALLNVSSTIGDINRTEIAAIKNTQIAMNDTMSTIQNDVMVERIAAELIGMLNYTDNVLKTQGKDILKIVTSTLVNRLLAQMDQLATDTANNIQQNLGRCRPLKTALDSVVVKVCQETLYPANGFWFSLGWFIMFDLLMLFFAFPLISLYRKTEEYDASDDKAFDGYAQVENIPLTDHSVRPNGTFPAQAYDNKAYHHPGYAREAPDYNGYFGGSPVANGHARNGNGKTRNGNGPAHPYVPPPDYGRV